jgi:hypothetical protein
VGTFRGRNTPRFTSGLRVRGPIATAEFPALLRRSRPSGEYCGLGTSPLKAILEGSAAGALRLAGSCLVDSAQRGPRPVSGRCFAKSRGRTVSEVRGPGTILRLGARNEVKLLSQGIFCDPYRGQHAYDHGAGRVRLPFGTDRADDSRASCGSSCFREAIRGESITYVRSSKASRRRISASMRSRSFPNGAARSRRISRISSVIESEGISDFHEFIRRADNWRLEPRLTAYAFNR